MCACLSLLMAVADCFIDRSLFVYFAVSSQSGMLDLK